MHTLEPDRTLSTNLGIFPIRPERSTTPAKLSGRRTLHILATRAVSADEVLVEYSDGSAAIFDLDELEKLRPVPKQIVRVGHPNPNDLGYTAASSVLVSA